MMQIRDELCQRMKISNDELNKMVEKRQAEKPGASATSILIAMKKELDGLKNPQPTTLDSMVEKPKEKLVPRGVDFDAPKPTGFHKAQRKESKLRLALTGASGSGKTYSALLLAQGLGGSVAVADTERGSAALYSNLFDFDTLEIEPPYSLKKWLDAIGMAIEARYNVLVLDSISPLWNGEGGLLEMKEQLAKHGKNSFTAWADVTPMYNKFVERMLNADIHIIATIRAKAEYAMEQDGGRTVVKKIGLGPQFRDGIDYEFTTVFDIGSDHSALVSKDRSGLFDAKTPFIISKETGQKIAKWLEGKN